MTFADKIEVFRKVLELAQTEEMRRHSYAWAIEYGHAKATVHVGSKYTRVDVGINGSGKYMVVNATGEIFGIKAYGVIHRGHAFGTLDTLDAWDWSGYRAVPLGTVRVLA